MAITQEMLRLLAAWELEERERRPLGGYPPKATIHPVGPVTGSAVVYEGLSLLTPEHPVVVIVTGNSKNEKTGDMAQAWILHGSMFPRDASATGADVAICGDCKLRGDEEGRHRGCYVNIARAPTNVFRAYQAGQYPVLAPLEASRRIFNGQMIRFGAYGDPAAVPYQVWSHLKAFASGWTGYTHQWRTCDPRLKALMMASVDSGRERREAAAMGWRTFRVIGRLSPPVQEQLEILCPASAEAGHRTTCAECNLCQGGERAGARSVAIHVHGQVRTLTFWRQRHFASMDEMAVDR